MAARIPPPSAIGSPVVRAAPGSPNNSDDEGTITGFATSALRERIDLPIDVEIPGGQMRLFRLCTCMSCLKPGHCIKGAER